MFPTQQKSNQEQKQREDKSFMSPKVDFMIHSFFLDESWSMERQGITIPQYMWNESKSRFFIISFWGQILVNFRGPNGKILTVFSFNLTCVNLT